MKTLTKIVSLLLVLGFTTHSALSATYKYRDESGNVVYSQNPPENPNTPYEKMGGIRSHALPSRNQQTPDNSSTKQSVQETGESNQQEEAIEKQVKQAKAIREKNCKAAKKNLEVYTVYRRIRNEKGEVIRVSDEERQKKIDEAKQAIKEFCN